MRTDFRERKEKKKRVLEMKIKSVINSEKENLFKKKRANDLRIEIRRKPSTE